MSETKICPYCGGEILAVAKKCKHCGQWLLVKCPFCDEDIPAGSVICPECGESLPSNKTAKEETKKTDAKEPEKSIAEQYEERHDKYIPIWVKIVVFIIVCAIVRIGVKACKNSKKLPKNDRIEVSTKVSGSEMQSETTYMSEYVDLGLPSGTLWKSSKEDGFYDYDSAVRYFGAQLPTYEQFVELIDYCTFTYDEGGCWVQGINGKGIYLDAAGWRDQKGRVTLVGTDGGYWSSTKKGSENAWYLNFTEKKGVVRMLNYSRSSGLSVILVKSAGKVAGIVYSTEHHEYSGIIYDSKNSYPIDFVYDFLDYDGDSLGVDNRGVKGAIKG